VSVGANPALCSKGYATSITLGARYVIAMRLQFDGQAARDSFSKRQNLGEVISMVESGDLPALAKDLGESRPIISFDLLQVGGRTSPQARNVFGGRSGAESEEQLAGCRDIIRNARSDGKQFMAMLSEHPSPEDNGA